MEKDKDWGAFDTYRARQRMGEITRPQDVTEESNDIPIIEEQEIDNSKEKDQEEQTENNEIQKENTERETVEQTGEKIEEPREEEENEIIDIDKERKQIEEPFTPFEIQSSDNIVIEKIEEKETKRKDNKEKKDFNEIIKTYTPSKIHKTRIIVMLVTITTVILILFNVATQKEKKPDSINEEGVNTQDYEPTFGNYKEKEMQEEKIVEDMKQLKEKEEFVLKKPPAYQKLPQQQYNGGYSQPPQKGLYEQAIASPLLKQVSGFGKPQQEQNNGYVMPINTQGYPAMPVNPMMSKNDYLTNSLNQISSLTGANIGGNKPDSVNNGRYSQAGAFNSENEGAGEITMMDNTYLFPGTIIHAVLVSGINTDYPADITARVIENVYDSKTGRNLLVPQGSILKGNYSSSSFGIGKVQIAWTDLIVSYAGVAYMTSLGGMAGVDQTGQAGIAGSINEHYWQWLKAAGIMSMFTILNSEISYQTKDMNNEGLKNLMDQNQAIVNRVGDRLIERALDIQPTVIVKNGTRVSVSVNTPIKMVPFEEIKPKQRFIR